MMTRREMILRTGAATLGLGLAGCSTNSAPRKPKQILFFSKSSGFEHSVIKSVDGAPSFAQKILTGLAPQHGVEFTFSKDGSLFTPEYLAKFDALFFYTTGDLTDAGDDKNPPMTPAGKQAFLDAIKNGKGFIGTHSAADTYHTNEKPDDWKKHHTPGRYKNFGDAADPYVKMLGAEFIIHGRQQKATMRVVDPKFPGFKDAGSSFVMNEEWYSLKDFAKNLHVLLVQETGTMEGAPYQRPPYPATWARKYGHGRVFYTSMGHREDVWTNPLYQEMLFGGIAWAVRNVNADVTPNIMQVTPDCWTLPPAPKNL
jgi:type 1 glutamine amidotransferase